MTLRIFTTGGTIDKVYFDAKSEYEVGEPVVGRILHDAGVTFEFTVKELLKKDSLDLTDDDRAMLYGAFLWMADKLRGDDGAHAAALWRRRGKRAFTPEALPDSGHRP